MAVGELDGSPVVISGGDDGTVRVWDLIGNDTSTIGIGSAVQAVEFVPPWATLVGPNAGLMLIELSGV